MVTPGAVTIVVNGAIVSGVTPARIRAGRVLAPLTPFVVRLVSRAAYDPVAGTIALERDGTRIIVPVVMVENGLPYVEVGRAVHALGGSANFDSPTKTLAIVLPPGPAIVTPAPFDPSLPQVEPTTIFTPSPPPARPRQPETGVPRPRRTAIPVVPSQPVAPPPDTGPTSRRR